MSAVVIKVRTNPSDHEFRQFITLPKDETYTICVTIGENNMGFVSDEQYVLSRFNGNKEFAPTYSVHAVNKNTLAKRLIVELAVINHDPDVQQMASVQIDSEYDPNSASKKDFRLDFAILGLASVRLTRTPTGGNRLSDPNNRVFVSLILEKVSFEGGREYREPVASY